MLQRFLTDPASASLARALDGYALRQRVTANNIANAETPGFVRSAVSFESQLKAAINGKKGDEAIESVLRVNPNALLDDSNPAKPDGNNVVLEQEMTELTKTNLTYRAAVTLIELKGSMIKTAITEGRR